MLDVSLPVAEDATDKCGDCGVVMDCDPESCEYCSRILCVDCAVEVVSPDDDMFILCEACAEGGEMKIMDCEEEEDLKEGEKNNG